MEGTHQKGSNYYRCRASATRGNSAARVAGHPGALQIKEDTVLDAVLKFMDRRLFGPERLKRLRDELARASGDQDEQHTKELEHLQAELKTSTRPDVGSRCAWRSTTTPSTPSSPSPRNASPS
jgi:hypothetical protein